MNKPPRHVFLFFCQFSIIGFGEIYPLWALSTVASGGLDWTTKQIGQVWSQNTVTCIPVHSSVAHRKNTSFRRRSSALFPVSSMPVACWRFLLRRACCHLLYCCCFCVWGLKLIDMGFEAVYPLWAISSVGSGGLDWSTKDVGQVRDTAVFTARNLRPPLLSRAECRRPPCSRMCM